MTITNVEEIREQITTLLAEFTAIDEQFLIYLKSNGRNKFGISEALTLADRLVLEVLLTDNLQGIKNRVNGIQIRTSL